MPLRKVHIYAHILYFIYLLDNKTNLFIDC